MPTASQDVTTELGHVQKNTDTALQKLFPPCGQNPAHPRYILTTIFSCSLALQ